MENEILKLASSQGIWAALSVVLIFYILKAQEKRDLKQEQ
ncbi:BhlA/UviB family holin-like peptide, partial [Clostridium botulinum]